MSSPCTRGRTFRRRQLLRLTLLWYSKVFTAQMRSPTVIAGLVHNASTGLSHLILQFAIILSVSSAMGWVFRRGGQPAVLGEMMAGILLGPSLFGLVVHKAFLFAFAPASLNALKLFSQIGVCIFMFAVGMELDLSQLRHSAHRF